MIDAWDAAVAVDGAQLLAPTDLHVARGEAVAVRGRNGSGKTTLLRLIAGLAHPTSGRVVVAGKPVAPRRAAFRRMVATGIGPVPFASGLTLREQLTLIGATWGRTVARAQAEADEILAEVTLSGQARRYPHELSSGQRQLADVAAVLVRPFDVLIIDEPEQRLDGDRVDAVIAALRRVRAVGATLVVTTHSERLADAVADRAVFLAAA